jgi:uridine kinase
MIEPTSPARDRALRELADRIRALSRHQPLRIAIDGPDAAGKSTLADELAARLRRRSVTVIRASVDAFQHPRKTRYARGRTSPDGYYRDAFDIRRLRTILLDPLGPSGDRHYATAVFDWRADAAVVPKMHVAPGNAILIVDGVFLLRPELRDAWDFSIFVWASEEECLARSKIRDATANDVASDVEQLFIARYAPAQRLYWAAASPMQFANVVVDNDDPSDPRVVYREPVRP